MPDAPGSQESLAAGPVFLFDGVCNLCNAGVDFIIQRDRGAPGTSATVRFASLQSATARDLLAVTPLADNPNGRLSATELSTSALIEDGVVYTKSTAALRVARRMRFPWPMAYVFIVVPPVLRDFVYNWIARNRLRWFGQRDTCRLPSAEEASRFL